MKSAKKKRHIFFYRYVSNKENPDRSRALHNIHQNAFNSYSKFVSRKIYVCIKEKKQMKEM